MANYVLCPRCELNYIDEDEQEYCEVCLKEMNGDKTFVDGLEENESQEETELCPICGENYMRFGETMCDSCKKKNAYEADESEDPDDDAWRTYLDEDPDEDDTPIPEGELDDEEEEEEEEEIYENDEDEFEYVSPDDYYGDEDDDDDDDDDDDF